MKLQGPPTIFKDNDNPSEVDPNLFVPPIANHIRRQNAKRNVNISVNSAYVKDDFEKHEENHKF